VVSSDESFLTSDIGSGFGHCRVRARCCRSSRGAAGDESLHGKNSPHPQELTGQPFGTTSVPRSSCPRALPRSPIGPSARTHPGHRGHQVGSDRTGRARPVERVPPARSRPEHYGHRPPTPRPNDGSHFRWANVVSEREARPSVQRCPLRRSGPTRSIARSGEEVPRSRLT
jgi:hypothetical protein